MRPLFFLRIFSRKEVVPVVLFPRGGVRYELSSSDFRFNKILTGTKFSYGRTKIKRRF